MLYDNRKPRYLPHLEHPEVLQMGLSPLAAERWIETDNSLPDYLAHKRRQRALHPGRVYQAMASSAPAQQELATLLLDHLCQGQDGLYRVADGTLLLDSLGLSWPLQDPEVLWNCSLWLADDLVLMEQDGEQYRLTAASLCSPSHWRLQDKFGLPMRAIHDPIPGFHQALSARIERFFNHLKPQHPVTRFNWSLQAHADLAQHPEQAVAIGPGTELFYRCERQTLLRLPATGAIAFTIRVYLHPLYTLLAVPGALPALLAAIDATPPDLAHYKDFDACAAALDKYRGRGHQAVSGG